MRNQLKRSLATTLWIVSLVFFNACGGSNELVLVQVSMPNELEDASLSNSSETSVDTVSTFENSASLENENEALSLQNKTKAVIVEWDDFYPANQQEIPKELSYRSVEEDQIVEEKDLYEGFRIQIYSGPSPAMADTVSKRFRTWSVRYLSGYSPETYTFFKAPYYRVHVGDFHERDRAYDVSQIIKRSFPDAWVVYDRVNPWNVPADSTIIRFQNAR